MFYKDSEEFLEKFWNELQKELFFEEFSFMKNFSKICLEYSPQKSNGRFSNEFLEKFP